MQTVRQLLSHNRNFRFLWYGQIVSQLGDWFNSVAMYALLFELTGSAKSVAMLMVMQILPIALVGPSAGVVADRYDRRRIMIAADVIRGVTVLGLLFVRTPSMVWLAYAVTAVTVGTTGFFEPARSLTVPLVVDRRELVAANAVSTSTWSAMVAIGASLGGIVSTAFGRDTAFVLNSLSFFASAVLISRMRIPPRPDGVRAQAGWHGLLEGVAYMRAHRHVARIAFVKGGWAVVGGALLLLAVFGDRIFRIGATGDAGIGVLYAARGIGAAAGSLAVAVAIRRSSAPLTRWIGPSYIAAGLAYATLGYAPSIWFAALTVVVAHTFGSVLWVASNVLLQTTVPDEFRGRVFAAELIALALVQSISTYVTAFALDELHTPPRLLAVAVGAALLAQGLVQGDGSVFHRDPKVGDRSRGPVDH